MSSIPVVGGLLDRLPAAVFVVAALILGPRLLQAAHVTPAQVSTFLGGSVLYDIQLAVALAPYLAALAALTGIVFLIAHHHVLATIAAGVMLFFIVSDFAWAAGVGTWATAHLTGAA